MDRELRQKWREAKWLNGNQRPGKKFARYFLIGAGVLLIVLIPLRLAASHVADWKPFSETVSGTPSQEPVDLTALMGHSMVDSDSPFFEAFQNVKRVNFLLLGVNTGLTDTIMLASFDMEAKHVDLISIPRDTYYPREGFNTASQKKLNAAYRGDVLNTAKAVSEILQGIPIHYYALIDYQGIANVVESIGGVPVEIPFEMDYDDPQDRPPLHIHFEKGPTTLHGDEAIEFLRFRENNDGTGYRRGDIDRVAAQQEFMKSAFRQAIGLKLPVVAKSVFQNVESNVDFKTLLAIAAQAPGLDESCISTYTLPGHFKTGEPYWYRDDDRIAELLEELYSTENSNGSDPLLKNNARS